MNNLFNTVRTFFSAPFFEGDEAKTRRAYLLNVVLNLQAFVVVLAFVGTVFVVFTTGTDQTIGLAVLGASFFLIMFWRFLMRIGKISVASAGLVIAFTLSISSAIAASGTIQSSAVVFLPISIVMAVLLISRRAGLVAFIGSTLVGMFIAQSEIAGSLPPIPNVPTNIVSVSISLITGMGLVLILLNLATRGVEDAIQRAQDKEQEVRVLAASLEQRVAERTKALETSAEVSRRLASILDPNQLASSVVNEIRNAYDYYYAQIYLFDDAGENLVLTAGTGEAGSEMLKRGHSLPKGRGLVGRAADTKETVLVSDTSQDPNWLPNDLLPNTKAEAAVPITIGGHVLGVLDVQDDVTNDINPGDITLLESLANQVAVSLNNARQYQQAQSLREQYALAVESSNDGVWDWDINNDSIYYSPRWKAMLGFEEHELTRGFVEWEERIHPEDRDYATKALEDYLVQRVPVYDVEIRLKHKDGTWRWIRDRGKALRHPDGRAYRMAGSHSDITERKQQEVLTAQRARQQEAINTITQRLQSTVTVEEALQVAARELGHALGEKQTLIKLESPSLRSGNESKN